MSPIVRFVVAWTRFCAEHRAELIDLLALLIIAVLLFAWLVFVPDMLIDGARSTDGS